MKKTVAVLLACALLGSTLPAPALAAETAPMEETLSARLEDESQSKLLTDGTSKELIGNGTCGDNLTWELDSEGTLTISGTGEMPDYGYSTQQASPWYSHKTEIRSIVLKEGITRIGSYAFAYSSNLTQVVEIPKSVREIGASAFLSCSNLEEVVLSNGVIKLENNCFNSCKNLKKLELPASVAYLEFQAFSNCTGLQEVTFQGNSPVFNETVFPGVTATAYYPGDNITWTENLRQGYGGTLTWSAYEGTGELPPEGIGEVVDSGTCGDNLTWELDSCGVLTISGSGDMTDYDYIQTSPWWDSYREEIRSVVLEEGITRIGDYAFNQCTNLTGVLEIPKSVTEIGATAFYYCENLAGVDLGNVSILGNNSFASCTNLKEIELPASVAQLGFRAFASCTGLKEMTFLGNAPAFGAYSNSEVFKGVTATAYYPGDNITWTENVMQNYGGSITWTAYDGEGEQPPEEPGDVVASGKCGDNLTWKLDTTGTLTISGTGDMYDYRYDNTSPWYDDYSHTIRTIVLEEGMTSIGDYAFYYCTNVAGSVEIPQSVSNIGESAFFSCESLAQVTIPEGVVELGSNVFAKCKNLDNVSVPASVVQVKFRAFDGCESLKTISFQGDAPVFGDRVFEGVTATAYYPMGNETWTDKVKQDYGGTITWMENLGGDNAWGVLSSWEANLKAGYLLYDTSLSDAEIRADLALSTPEQALYRGVGGAVEENGNGSYEQMFTFAGAKPGTYKLAIYKSAKYAPQIVKVTIGQGNMAMGDFSLNAYGDINGDGRVNTMDVSAVNAYVKNTASLTEYQKLCADANHDGRLNTMDVSLINAHVKGVGALW